MEMRGDFTLGLKSCGIDDDDDDGDRKQDVNRELKKSGRGRRCRQAVKIFRHNPCVFLACICFGNLFVSIFAEIQLPSARISS